MSGDHKVTEKALIAALKKCGGILAFAAKEVGVTRQAVHDRVKKSAKLQKVVRDIKEETLDVGEGHIVKGVREGDKFYVNMYMQAQGKTRGYGKDSVAFDDAQIKAFIAALGGDPEKYRACLLQLGHDPDKA